MTAPVRIDAAAWGDLRFATLARLCGFADAEHALIKCAKIWSWQTEHYTPECPTYVVEVDLVESALGAGGAAHLVRARLAEEGPDGLRIRGSKDRIEWLWKARNASNKGGEATRRKHANKGRPGGQPAAPAMARPTDGPEVGPLTLSPDPSGSQNPLAPRAIEPTAYSTARDTWAAVSAARVQLAAELRIANVIALPDRFGVPSEPRGCRDLRERVREEGDEAAEVCRHIVENLVAQAREEKSVEWLSEKAFTAGGWQTARNWVPGQQQQRSRAGPKRGTPTYGSTNPSNKHPEEPALRPASEVL